MLDYLEVKIERWAFAGERTHEMRITCSFGGQKYNVRQVFLPTELKSYFSQIWERMGREVEASINAAQQSVQADVCHSCGATYAPSAQYCHNCGTRR